MGNMVACVPSWCTEQSAVVPTTTGVREYHKNPGQPRPARASFPKASTTDLTSLIPYRKKRIFYYSSRGFVRTTTTFTKHFPHRNKLTAGCVFLPPSVNFMKKTTTIIPLYPGPPGGEARYSPSTLPTILKSSCRSGYALSTLVSERHPAGSQSKKQVKRKQEAGRGLLVFYEPTYSVEL